MLKINNKLLKIGGKTVAFGDIILKLHFDSVTNFKFTLKDEYHYNCTFIWGDGTTEKLNYYDDDNNGCTSTSSSSTSQTPEDCFSALTHTYQTGDYYLRIKGRCETLAFPGNENIIEVVSWGLAEITKLSYIKFSSCSNLNKLPNESSGLKYIENLDDAFGYTAINNIYQNIFKNLTITSMKDTFTGTQITEANIKIPSSVTDISGLYSYCDNLKTINLDLNNVTKMNNCFRSSGNNNIINIYNLDLSNIIECTQYIYNDSVIFHNLKISNTTPNEWQYVYHSDYDIKKIINLDTTNLTALSIKLKYLTYISFKDTTSITNMTNLFNNCTSLVNIINLNTSNATTLEDAFSDTKIKKLNSLNTSNCSNFDYLFDSCHDLICIPSIDTSLITRTQNNTFSDCDSLIEPDETTRNALITVAGKGSWTNSNSC